MVRRVWCWVIAVRLAAASHHQTASHPYIASHSGGHLLHSDTFLLGLLFVSCYTCKALMPCLFLRSLLTPWISGGSVHHSDMTAMYSACDCHCFGHFIGRQHIYYAAPPSPTYADGLVAPRAYGQCLRGTPITCQAKNKVVSLALIVNLRSVFTHAVTKKLSKTWSPAQKGLSITFDHFVYVSASFALTLTFPNTDLCF